MVRGWILVVAVAACCGCVPKQDGPKTVSPMSETGKSEGALKPAPKSDDLVGKWVCVSTKRREKPDIQMEFRADGTGEISAPGEPSLSIKYRLEGFEDSLARSGVAEGASKSPFYREWVANGVVIVTIIDPKTGQEGERLLLDPKNKILQEPLESIYCRPGDEARVRELSGINKNQERANLHAKTVNDWKPEKDVTSKFRQIWTLPMSELGRGVCSMAVAVSDNGAPQIVAPDADGFVVVDQKGSVVRKISTPQIPGRFFVTGMSQGHAVVCQFKTWGDSITAYDLNGKQLWQSGPNGGGINWVAPVTVDSKNTDFAVATTGQPSGVTLFSSTGVKKWSSPIDANVWNVASGRLSKSAPESVLAVGPNAGLSFGADGKQSQIYGPTDAGAIGSGDLDGDGTDEVLTLGTTVASGGMLTVFSPDGKKKWSQAGSGVDVSYLSQPFISGQFKSNPFVGVASGVAIRFYEADGKLFGEFVDKRGIKAVSVMPMKGSGTALLVRFRNGLSCYQLK